MDAEGRLLRLRHEDLRTRAPALGVQNAAGSDVDVSVREVYDELFGVGGVHHKTKPVERQRRLKPKEIWLWGYGTPREDVRGQDAGGFFIVLDDGSPPLSCSRCRLSEVRIRGAPPGEMDYEELRVWVQQSRSAPSDRNGKPSMDRVMEATLLKSYGSSELFAPVESDDAALVKEVLGRQADPLALRTDGASPLHLAAHSGHTAALQILLDSKIHPDVAYTGSTKGLSTTFADVLLQPNGPALETQHSPRTGRSRSLAWTPLHLATARGHLEAMRLLLVARADTGQETSLGETALQLALSGGHLEHLRLLLRAHANPNATAVTSEEDGSLCPLGMALSHGREDIARLLLRFKAEPNEKLPPALALRVAELVAPSKTDRFEMRYRIVAPGSLPPVPASNRCNLNEVRAPNEAVALFRGCPPTQVVCCGFGGPLLDPRGIQRQVLQELAQLRPRGLTFVHADIEALPTIAGWAGVRLASDNLQPGQVVGPLVRLYQANISVISDFQVHKEGGLDALRKQILGISKAASDSAQGVLEETSGRHPGALHGEPIEMAPKDTSKMHQQGLALLQSIDSGEGEKACFVALSSACGGSVCPRPRDVATLAKLIRRLPVKDLLPLVDLARRLLPHPSMGGSAPGARHAAEMLLDAVLQRGLDDPEAEFKLNSLAMQGLSNALVHRNLREGLLPSAGLLVGTRGWELAWAMCLHRAREAAAVLLFNCSVALRHAAFLSERTQLMTVALKALREEPQNQPLNWAVGNLLAVEGRPEEAATALRAQPLPPLRRLAAEVLRGPKPSATTFPEAWAA